MRHLVRTAFLGGVLVALGCGGSATQIVPTSQIGEAAGKPVIKRIVDLGDISVPDKGALPTGDSDGVYVVGELLLIQGSMFGRQPTIMIGSRPADPIARMGDGAIITRIPPGVSTGKVKVRVSHRAGASEKHIKVRRYHFVVQPNAPTVHVLRVAAGREPTRQAGLGIANAKGAAITGNGQTGLFAVDDGGGKPWIGVVAVTASGGPKLVHHTKLQMKNASSILMARRAKIAAVMGKRSMTLLDLSTARNPAPYDAWTLPKNVEAPVAAAMHPNGKLIVLLLPTSNELIGIDISMPTQPKVTKRLGLFPTERVPVVRDLKFTPKGDELWVLSGDTDLSLVAGNHPSKLTAVTVEGTTFKVRRTVDVQGVNAIYGLAIAPRERIRGGTALRSLDRVAEVVVMGVDRAVWEARRTKKKNSELLAQPKDLVQLVRTNMEGTGSILWHAEAVATAVALSHDVGWSLAAVTKIVRPKGGGAPSLVFGALLTPINDGPAEFVQLGKVASGADLLAPGSVALAP